MEFTGRRGLKILKIAGMVIGGITMAVLFALLFGWVFQMLWNWLMPELFGFKVITYLQAFAIVILAKILFGSFGSHSSGKDKDHNMPWDRNGGGCKNGHSRKNRKHFKNFWEEEGKDAFEAYLKKIENPQSEPDSKK
jgi:hypothetical protein